MNNKDCVYLKELDSVNQTYEEQIIAEKALYNALVYQGKTVILTYNQIVDSIAFLHCIKDEMSFTALLDYFKDGKLLVNQYKNDMNISKYFQMNYHSDTFFKSSYFSFLQKYSKDVQNSIYDGLNKSIQYGDDLYLRNFLPIIEKEDKESIFKYIEFILTINAYMYEYNCYWIPNSHKTTDEHLMADYMRRTLLYLEKEKSLYYQYFNTLMINHESHNRGNTRSQYVTTLEETVPHEFQYVIRKLIDLAYNNALEYSIFFEETEEQFIKDFHSIIVMSEKEDNRLLAPVKDLWKEGYRVSYIATLLFNKFSKLNWTWSLRICPIVEIMRILTSLIVAFVAMLLIESLTSIQVIWQTYSIALLVTFVYNIILDELQEFIMKRLPEWLSGSGFTKQIKNFVMDIYVIGRKNQI